MDTYPDVAILCGGKGTRFQSVVPNQPKSMAPINGRPFLDLLLTLFISAGFHRIILCTGYMATAIEEYYTASPFAPFLIFSREKEPLGTGGALKAAQSLFTAEDIIVSNGDSYCPVDLRALLTSHRARKDAAGSIVLTAGRGRRDAGDVIVDTATQRITTFREKSMSGDPLVSAGIYCIRQSAFAAIPMGKNYSIEYEFFPTLLSHGLYGFVTDGPCIDIGTPERYQSAVQFFMSNATL